MQEYDKCKILMAQVILLANSLGTLDLNYFKHKIRNEEMREILFGSGPNSLKELNYFFDNLELETLSFDELLAIECFSKKLDFLPTDDTFKALDYIDSQIKATIEENRNELDDSTLNFYSND